VTARRPSGDEPARPGGVAGGPAGAPGAGRPGGVRPPLTLGTAGHIDHGKTALVAALTGIDTDRLPEEHERGISIELGYAPLTLPSGRRLSIVDVPGHERFVRTMVAGATGIDLYLMTVAADDGVMPQTREHAAVLAGLGVEHGVVAVTKCDLRHPAAALAQAAALLPGAEAVAVSARTGDGLDDLRAALDRVAALLPGRAADEPAPAVLHVDRSFTIHGVGTVVTGTLWAGEIGRGDELDLLPAGRRVRVRGTQVHDAAVERAAAGQRVAVNLTGVERREVRRGDVLAAPGADLAASHIVDVALDARPEHGARVQVHHGTRESPARVAALGGRFFQLRLEQPLVAARGDRLVVRSIAPADTLGGGVVLDPVARRHGPGRDVLARLTRLWRGEPEPEEDDESAAAASPGATHSGATRSGAARTGAPSALAGAPPAQQHPQPLPPAALELEDRLRAAGAEGPLVTELDRDALRALRAAGRAVRVGRLAYHPDAIAEVRRRVEAVIGAEGSITLARLRDELGTSRKFAQALLEHLDQQLVTRRRDDETRVLRTADAGHGAPRIAPEK
jgi:selenocysteine-specific elongation factor